jgi:hypothetical protein
MPSRTPRQHRAMEAAAHGRGKLGIPPKVAQEFVNADAAKKPSIGKALGSAAKKPMPPRPRKRGAK